jgi:hypothetical protein
METSSSAHMGQTRFSLVIRRVALQKHDLHSAKCRPDVLLSILKFSITMLFVDIYFQLNKFKLIFVAKYKNIVIVMLYGVGRLYFYHIECMYVCYTILSEA